MKKQIICELVISKTAEVNFLFKCACFCCKHMLEIMLIYLEKLHRINYLSVLVRIVLHWKKNIRQWDCQDIFQWPRTEEKENVIEHDGWTWLCVLNIGCQ